MDKSALGELIASHCHSVFDGCACGKKKHPDDELHECAADDCDGTWTTEQATAWEAEAIASGEGVRFPKQQLGVRWN